MNIVWELDEDLEDGSYCFELGLRIKDYLEYGLHVNVYYLSTNEFDEEGDDRWHVDVRYEYPSRTEYKLLDRVFDTEMEARQYAEQWATEEYRRVFDSEVETALLDQLYAILHPNRNMLTGELARIYRCVDKTLHP